MERSSPTLVYAAVAFIAGLAGSFASIRPNLVEMLPGVAISVTLIPPLSVIGIGIVRLDWYLISGSFMLFLVNIAGIIFAGLLVFLLTNFYGTRSEAKKIIKKEDKAIAKEEGKLIPTNSA